LLAGSADLSTVLRGASIVLAIRVAASALTYVAMIVLARWMGAQEYGIYTYVLAWAALLAMPAGFGLHAACVRFVPEYAATGAWGKVRGILSRAAVLTLVSGTLIALVALAGARGIVARIPSGYGAALGLAIAGVPILAMSRLGAQVGRAFGWVGIGYAPAQVAHPVLLILAVLLAGTAGAMRAEPVVAIALGLSLLLVVLQAFLYGSRLAPRLRGVRAEYDQRRWLRVAVPLLLIDGFSAVLAQSDLIMVGTLLGATATAHYAVATRTAALATFFLDSISGLAGPKIAELNASGRRDDLRALLADLAPWIVVPTVATLLGLAVAGPWLLRLFGRGFDAGYVAMVILTLGNAAGGLVGPTALVLNMTGEQDATARAYGIAAAANVLLNALLIPPLGIVGAACATGMTDVAVSVWLHTVVRRRFAVAPALVLTASRAGGARHRDA
jgi:O-antigen/teichoic acid export membrane protein